MLYWLLTGRPPFAAETQIATAMQHVREAPPSPRSIRADVSRPLEAVILRTLEKDPDRRFDSAAELVLTGKAMQPDAVLWPENATDIDPFHDERVRTSIESLAAAATAAGGRALTMLPSGAISWMGR